MAIKWKKEEPTHLFAASPILSPGCPHLCPAAGYRPYQFDHNLSGCWRRASDGSEITEKIANIPYSLRSFGRPSVQTEASGGSHGRMLNGGGDDKEGGGRGERGRGRLFGMCASNVWLGNYCLVPLLFGVGFYLRGYRIPRTQWMPAISPAS